MNYDFYIKKLIQRYLPWGLRSPKILAWLYVLFSAIETIKTIFLAFVPFAKKEARMNGQVIVLETYLNDKYDATQRRIKIMDNSGRYFIKSDINAYILSSVTPLIIPSLNDFNFSVDFVVKTPFTGFKNAFIQSNLNAYTHPYYLYNYISNNSITAEIKAVIKKYKISGKTFQIDII